MSLSNSLRAFLTVEWLHCSGGRSSSLGQLRREKKKREREGGGDMGGGRAFEKKIGIMRNNSDGEQADSTDSTDAILN